MTREEAEKLVTRAIIDCGVHIEYYGPAVVRALLAAGVSLDTDRLHGTRVFVEGNSYD